MFTFDKITGYIITKVVDGEHRCLSYHDTFHDAATKAKAGERIELICGTGEGNNQRHLNKCRCGYHFPPVTEAMRCPNCGEL